MELRISTSPPNDWDGDADEASHYCDIREVDDWRSSPVLARVPEPVRDGLLRSGLAGYAVAAVYADRGIGLLVCVDDEQDGVAYVGIDRHGRTSRQPAANEAFWHAANAAMGRGTDRDQADDLDGDTTRDWTGHRQTSRQIFADRRMLGKPQRSG